MTRGYSKYDMVSIALSQVAELVRHGDYKKAREILGEVISIADSIEDIDEKFASFFQIARAYIMIGDSDKAREVFESIYEELENVDTIRSKFYRLVIKVEKVKYGLIKQKEKLLESIRMGFRELFLETNDVSIARYYIAFIVLMWVPFYKYKDLEYSIEILRRLTDELKMLKNDPQYAEILTTLAELEAERGNFGVAIKLFKDAVDIYKVNPQHFKETIKSILLFIKERIPDKYEDFINMLKNDGILGDYNGV